MAGFRNLCEVGVALAVLVGCAAPDPLALRSLPKGEPLGIRAILAAHPNQNICVDYEAKTDSCASVITATLRGSVMQSREVAIVRTPDGAATQQIAVRTRSKVVDGGLCSASNDVTVEGRDAMAQFVQDFTRGLVDEFGGSVCASYFRAADGDGYVIRTTGANGQPFPPGEQTARFVTGPAKLWVQ
ncbi:hypothetical protein ABMC88_10965 [Sulfitobacter sp. HNIBRBA2951]|uniref:hypothetical protein n=1 Tax=Sulfitobacter aquimarinus TaxID=3158557 RepID=UPI0032DF5E4F